MKVLVIIPAYNECENIEKTVNKICKLELPKKYKLDYVVINDGSIDNTKEICEKNGFNVINLINNLGIGGAVQTGYKYAYYNNYDVAIQFDGDGQHDENFILELLKQIENGNDLVIGSRFVEKLSEFTSTSTRKIGIKILSFMIKLFTKFKIYDPTSGYRAANKRIISCFYNSYPVEYPEPPTVTEIIRKGFKVKEIPVKMYEREHGTSSINLTKSIYYMISVCIAIVVASLGKR